MRALPLGEGSNIVFSGDYLGVVIHNTLLGRSVIEEDESSVLIEVAGGENWHQLVTTCLQQGWYGLENLALIPGTVGAAPIQNIGAYGVELADVFDSLNYLAINDPAQATDLVRLDKQQCEFGYRDSVFKHRLRDNACVTSVRLRLSKQPVPNASYPALTQWLKEHELQAVPKTLYQAVCSLRRSKLPDPKRIPNAGSFFKNPVISLAACDAIQKGFADIPCYDAGEGHKKLAAGWMIEKAGWRGRDCDSTGMHRDQALVLVNPAKAKGEQVLRVANAVADSVHAMFNIRLEIEPRIYPRVNP